MEGGSFQIWDLHLLYRFSYLLAKQGREHRQQQQRAYDQPAVYSFVKSVFIQKDKYHSHKHNDAHENH